MSRFLAQGVRAGVRQILNKESVSSSSAAALAARRTLSTHGDESPEEFDQRFIDYFNRPNIDGWEVRKGTFRAGNEEFHFIKFLLFSFAGMTELQGHDVVPDPKIVAAGLRACRRVSCFVDACKCHSLRNTVCIGQ